MKTALDVEMEALLAESRRVATPRANDRQRISAALRARLGADVPDDPRPSDANREPSTGAASVGDAAGGLRDAPAARSAVTLSRSAWLRIVVLTGAASGLLGFALGYGLHDPAPPSNGAPAMLASGALPSTSGSSTASEAAAPWAPAPPHGSDADVPRPAPATNDARGDDAPPRGSSTTAPRPARVASTPTRAARPASRAPRSDSGVDGAVDELTATSTAHDSEWPFSEILERLRRAHLALGQGRASLALVQLAELDRHAGATLLEERAMTRVLTLCALGEVAAARQAARPLLVGDARSIYTQRLEQSCAAPPP